MENKEKNSFTSLEEKCQYYIKEYETYKSKFILLNQEYERVLENNKKLYENINKERKLRKELEEKLKYSNTTNKSQNTINKKENNFHDDFVVLEKNIEPADEELLNICNEFKNKNYNIIKAINFSIRPKNYIGEKINDEGNQKNEKEKINIIKEKNNNNFKQNDEFITEELLKKDFIKYSKDTILLSNTIYEKELKIDKIYILIKKLIRFFNIIKGGATFFNKSIIAFNKYLSLYNEDNKNILNDWPFLTQFISVILKSFSTINIYCSSLIMSIDSSSIQQINSINEKNFKNIYNIRNRLQTKKEEFIILQNNFFVNKNYEQMKTKYYNDYKTYELLKYDYISSINKFIMTINLKLPEIMSLLSYSYITYFNKVNDELNQTNTNIRKTLENLLNSVNIKNKIENEINTNRKKITDLFQTYDKTKKEKEGFLLLKEKDSGKFKKRYVQIFNGHLIYYNLKKNARQNFENLDNNIFTNIIDNVNKAAVHDICNLLFSSVKKCDKNYPYPFCFEMNIASTKTGYVFQADTEYEMEEWISTITNAITYQISDFDGNKTNNKIDNNNNKDKNKDIDNNFFIAENENDLLKMKNQNLIKILIENNVCSDCGAKNPTWLNINWMNLLCVECSGIHRSLGVQISKIKSLELDNINNDYLDILFLLKQIDINNILEEKLNDSGDSKPKFNDSREEKEKFIIKKYKNKIYLNIICNNNDDIIKNIFENIEKDNLVNVFKLIKLYNIDINGFYSYKKEELGLVHYSVKLGRLFIVKLLYIIGANITLKDKKGLKPIDYIKEEEQAYFYDYLKDK